MCAPKLSQKGARESQTQTSRNEKLSGFAMIETSGGKVDFSVDKTPE
jgi:hypothetical protein